MPSPTISLNLHPLRVREGATALVRFQGPPHRAVLWRIDGPAALAAFAERTDEYGIALARVTPDPGSAGQSVTVTVRYVL